MSATTKPSTDQSSDAQNEHLCCDEEMPEAVYTDNSKLEYTGTAQQRDHAYNNRQGPLIGMIFSSDTAVPTPTVFTPGSGPFVLGEAMSGHLGGSGQPQAHSTIIKAEPGGFAVNGCPPMQLSAPSSCSELGNSLVRPQSIPAAPPAEPMMHSATGHMFQGGIFSATSPSAAQAAAAAKEAFAALATSGGYAPGFGIGASTFSVPKTGFASSVPQGWRQQPGPVAVGPAGRTSLHGAGSAGGNGLVHKESVCGKRMSNGMLSPRSTLQSSQQSSMLSSLEALVAACELASEQETQERAERSCKEVVGESPGGAPVRASSLTPPLLSDRDRSKAGNHGSNSNSGSHAMAPSNNNNNGAGSGSSIPDTAAGVATLFSGAAPTHSPWAAAAGFLLTQGSQGLGSPDAAQAHAGVDAFVVGLSGGPAEAAALARRGKSLDLPRGTDTPGARGCSLDIPPPHVTSPPAPSPHAAGPGNGSAGLNASAFTTAAAAADMQWGAAAGRPSMDGLAQMPSGEYQQAPVSPNTYARTNGLSCTVGDGNAGAMAFTVGPDGNPRYRRHKSKVFIRPNKVVYLPTTFMEEAYPDPACLPINCEMVVERDGVLVMGEKHNVTIKAVPRQGLSTMYCMTNVMRFQQQYLNWQILNWTKIDETHIKIHLQSPVASGQSNGKGGQRASLDEEVWEEELSPTAHAHPSHGRVTSPVANGRGSLPGSARGVVTSGNGRKAPTILEEQQGQAGYMMPLPWTGHAGGAPVLGVPALGQPIVVPTPMNMDMPPGGAAAPPPLYAQLQQPGAAGSAAAALTMLMQQHAAQQQRQQSAQAPLDIASLLSSAATCGPSAAARGQHVDGKRYSESGAVVGRGAAGAAPAGAAAGPPRHSVDLGAYQLWANQLAAAAVATALSTHLSAPPGFKEAHTTSEGGKRGAPEAVMHQATDNKSSAQHRSSHGTSSGSLSGSGTASTGAGDAGGQSAGPNTSGSGFGSGGGTEGGGYRSGMLEPDGPSGPVSSDDGPAAHTAQGHDMRSATGAPGAANHAGAMATLISMLGAMQQGPAGQQGSYHSADAHNLIAALSCNPAVAAAAAAAAQAAASAAAQANAHTSSGRPAAAGDVHLPSGLAAGGPHHLRLQMEMALKGAAGHEGHAPPASAAAAAATAAAAWATALGLGGPPGNGGGGPTPNFLAAFSPAQGMMHQQPIAGDQPASALKRHKGEGHL